MKRFLWVCFFLSSCVVNIKKERVETKEYFPLFFEHYQKTGVPFKGTVIFFNGSGNSLMEWTETKNKPFFDCAKDLGNLFMYDRNGVGKSPPDLSTSLSNPITSKRVVSKLIRLLKKEKIKPPYILVGFSYGGLFAGHFALTHPELVQGVLLVDPSPPEFEYSDSLMEKYKEGHKAIEGLHSKEAYKTFASNQKNPNGVLPAHLIYLVKGFKQTKKEINKLLPINQKIPVLVLSSTGMVKSPDVKGDWFKLQSKWLNKNKLSGITRVESGHGIHDYNKHPLLVCEQIKKLISP